MFGLCKKTPEYTLLPQADGRWGVRYNHTNIPYVISTYPSIKAARKAVENLKRESIDIW